MDKKLQTLGLATKAGFIISGEGMVVDSIRSNKVYLCFLANDASINTSKKITDKAKFYNVEVCNDFSSDELSQAIGKNNRMVVGVTSINFAKILKK